MQLKKKISLIFLSGLAIGALFFGGYFAYSAIQSEVGLNVKNTTPGTSNIGSWIPLNQVLSNADGILFPAVSDPVREATLDTQSISYGFNGTTFDRQRSGINVDASAPTGFLSSTQFLFNGTTYDRSRSASIGDASAATGLHANNPFIFNGTTFDRIRASTSATGTSGTGIAANGPMIFDTINSLYVRARGSSIGEQITQSLPRQLGVTNSQTTGAADTAVVVTLTTTATQQAYIHKVTARCSAGTSSLTVTNGVATVWSTPAAAVGTSNLTEEWRTSLTSAIAADPVITLATCGPANTGTLIVQASINEQ